MKLIALALIAAGALAANSAEVAKGASFEAPDDVAADLIKQGLAKEDAPAAAVVKTTKVRLLMSSHLGNANDVVDIPTADVKGAEASGTADSAKAAVAYAMTLPQNQATQD
jgi:hypothetical protein